MFMPLVKPQLIQTWEHGRSRERGQREWKEKMKTKLLKMGGEEGLGEGKEKGGKRIKIYNTQVQILHDKCDQYV